MMKHNKFHFLNRKSGLFYRVGFFIDTDADSRVHAPSCVSNKIYRQAIIGAPD